MKGVLSIVGCGAVLFGWFAAQQSFAEVKVSQSGQSCLEEACLITFDAGSDDDLELVGLSDYYRNERFTPSEFNLRKHLDNRIQAVQCRMNLPLPTQVDFLLLISPVNTAVLGEMTSDPLVKVVQFQAYQKHRLKLKFRRTRTLGGIKVNETGLLGLKSVTFKTRTGFLYRFDLDPDHELYRHIALTSRTAIELE
ncbi:hypothetical protein GOB57_09275 [Sinorhizobium meliloti]|nr:hypothetical protein [Sinorhizobium meliloti]